MSESTKLAKIYAEVAHLSAMIADLEGYRAENKQREMQGLSVAYVDFSYQREECLKAEANLRKLTEESNQISNKKKLEYRPTND